MSAALLLVCGVERLDHHLLLSAIPHKQPTAVKHQSHRVNHPVEAACCSAFLGKSNNAHLLSLAVLNNRHHLCGNGNLFNVQIYIC